MKKHIATIGLLVFTVGLFSLQSSSINAYAANSKGIRQDTIPHKDTTHKKWKHKMKGDSSWPKKDTMPH